MTVDVDNNSGFCAGVIRAIDKAEEYLDKADVSRKRLYSLGAIVHNESELNRLASKGLVTIDREDLSETRAAEGETLLIRAHGEPPETYRQAESIGFNIIDCTCPVVLKLQKDIRDAYVRLHEGPRKGQIAIFGKIGHPEVLGLLGQTDGDAVVIENMKMLEDAVGDGRIGLTHPVEIFSQTTRRPAMDKIDRRTKWQALAQLSQAIEYAKACGEPLYKADICLIEQFGRILSTKRVWIQ